MGIVVKICWLTVQYTVLNVWMLAVVIPLIAWKYWQESKRKSLDASGRLDGKTYIITGCNKGVGLYTALEMSKRGARVLMACRNLGSAHLAKNAIAKYSGNDDIDVYRLDLSSFWSVRQFVKDIQENEGRIDGIIFNAGMGLITSKYTKDGLPLVWQVNYFSSVLIINLLLGFLKKAGSAQIIFVSSTLHHFNRFNIDDLKCEKKSCPWTIYCNTKVANLMTSNFLAKKLKGTGITVNCVNPGLVNTEILRRVKNQYFQFILQTFLEFYGKSEEDGAATALTLLLDPSLQSATGKYFANCQESTCLSGTAKDVNTAEKLWEKSKKLVELQADEIAV